MSIKSFIHNKLEGNSFVFGVIYALMGGGVVIAGSGLAFGVMVVVTFFTPKVNGLLMSVGRPLLHWANFGQSGNWVIAQMTGLLTHHPLIVGSGLACLVFMASLVLALPYAFASYGFFSKNSYVPATRRF